MAKIDTLDRNEYVQHTAPTVASATRQDVERPMSEKNSRQRTRRVRWHWLRLRMTDKDDQVALTRGSVATLAALAAMILGVHTAIMVPLVEGIATREAHSTVDAHEEKEVHSGAMPRDEIADELRELRGKIDRNSEALAAIKATVLELERR